MESYKVTIGKAVCCFSMVHKQQTAYNKDKSLRKTKLLPSNMKVNEFRK